MSTRKRSDDDFDREIRAHIELETERLIDDGLTTEEARVAARRRFGNVTVVRERFYESGRLLWLDHLIQDLRCAARNMRRYPVASLVAVLSLAAGIGATTVTLTMRDVIFRKLPRTYQHPEQLSKIQVGSPASPIMPVGNPVPVALYQRWRETMGPSIAAYTSLGVREIRAADRTASVPVRAVTPELFAILGVAPSPGASFSASAHSRQRPAAGRSSAIGCGRSSSTSAPDVIGRVVWIDDEAHTVIGVMPERFWFSDMDSPIWTALDPRTLPPDARVGVVVRRPADATHAMLEAQAPERARRLRAAAARRRASARREGVRPRRHADRPPDVVRPALRARHGRPADAPHRLRQRGHPDDRAVDGARARDRDPRIDWRQPRPHRALAPDRIGADRRSAAASSASASRFALRGCDRAQQRRAALFFDLSIDARIFLQTAVIALVTGIAAGIAPALYETRRLHTNPLRTIATSDRVRQRWRHALVVFEIAVTIALLVVTDHDDRRLLARRAMPKWASPPAPC